MVVQVCDSTVPAACATQLTTLTLNHAPVITSTPPVTTTPAGVSITYPVTVTDPDGPGPITYSVDPTDTCGGTIDSSGNYTVTPAASPSTCTLAVRACDSANPPSCTTQSSGLTVASPSVEFASASQLASEASPAFITVTVQLSSAAPADVTVPYTISGAAAQPGDYGIVASPLVIAAGSTTGTLTIQVMGDSELEPDEDIVITLGTPTNATLGAGTVHTVTITNFGTNSATGGLPGSGLTYGGGGCSCSSMSGAGGEAIVALMAVLGAAMRRVRRRRK
jgi:MYXO-CTERM domain-containing protein